MIYNLFLITAIGAQRNKFLCAEEAREAFTEQVEPEQHTEKEDRHCR
jgi:hypothetical protein